MSPKSLPSRNRARAGSTVLLAVGALVLIAIAFGGVMYFVRSNQGPATEAPLVKAVNRGKYEHTVLEQGEVESSSNVEIRCEIRSRSGGTGPSTSIIDVIPEGSVVEEGDWLITFDSSGLDQELSRQRITVNTSEAIMIQAKATYDTALIAKDEYIKGAYNEQRKAIENEIFVAEENLKKAQLSHDSIKRLVSRGLLTSLQLDGEKFRVDAAQNELDLARQKLEVLDNFTKQKMLTQLDSDIAAAQVKWRNEQDSHQEELNNLKEIEEQIEKCKLVAPQAGQVVYANVQSSRSGSEFVVEPGASVRERQAIIRLPDPDEMQVKAKINESRINLVREGMPVTIRIDAFGDESVEGVVTKVNKYAEPGNWWSSSAKEYVTLIKIVNPPTKIRVGLTAEVRIHVDHRDDVLQVPVQAIYERNGKTFCLVENGDAWDTREVVVASTNEKTVAIDEEMSDPIKEGENVVMNPRKHLNLFDQSRFPTSAEPPPPAGMDMSKAKQPAGGPGAVAGGEGEGAAKGGGGRPGGAGGGEAGGGVAGFISRFDSDKDGKLSTDELPERMRAMASSADSNGDGGIDAAELGKLFSSFGGGGGGGRPGGPGGGGGRPGGPGGGRPGGPPGGGR